MQPHTISNLRKQSRSILIGLTFASLTSGIANFADGASASAKPVAIRQTAQTNGEQHTCGDFARINDGPYLYVNNMWGAYQQPKTASWTQCLDRHQINQRLRQYSFTWSWPYVAETLQAPFGFPSVSFGKNPNFPTDSTTALLPARIDVVKKMSATAVTSIKANGAYDEFYNIFYVSSTNPATIASAVTVELAVVIRHEDASAGDGFPFQPHVKDITIDNQAFGLYVNPTFTPPNAGSRILAFLVPRQLPLQDTVNIKAINDVLIKQGYVHDTDYIANVDLGVEMYNSLGGNHGQLVINQFAVSIESK